MRKASLLLLAACTLAAPASAGEVNGNGDPLPLAGASICKFSGLNDDPDSIDPFNPPGRTQSFGQDVRAGRVDPTDRLPEEPEFHPHPGFSCNPNTFIPPEF